MSDQDSVSQPAKLALISLSDRSDLDTARAIETGPWGIEQIDAQAIEDGLVELAALDQPQVVPKSGGGWRLA